MAKWVLFPIFALVPTFVSGVFHLPGPSSEYANGGSPGLNSNTKFWVPEYLWSYICIIQKFTPADEANMVAAKWEPVGTCVILSPTTGLTSATVFTSNTGTAAGMTLKNLFRVVVGTKQTNSTYGDQVQTAQITEMKTSKFVPTSFDNNIELIKWENPISSATRSYSYSKPLNVANVYCGDKINFDLFYECYMVGFGATSQSETPFTALNFHRAYLIDQVRCQELVDLLKSLRSCGTGTQCPVQANAPVVAVDTIRDENFCANFGGMGLACQGDQGAAMICRLPSYSSSYSYGGYSSPKVPLYQPTSRQMGTKTDQFVVVGILSYENGPACPGPWPTVFTNPGAFQTLFKENGFSCSA